LNPPIIKNIFDASEELQKGPLLRLNEDLTGKSVSFTYFQDYYGFNMKPFISDTKSRLLQTSIR